MTTYIMNWGVFFEELPGGGERYWQLIVSGVGWTLAVSACAWVIALTLGSVIGTIRTTDRPWMVHFGNAWVEFFRNIPLLVQMFLWYFVVPEFIPPLKSWIVQTNPANAQFVSAVLCLGLFTSARVAEQVRAGIQSLARGQRIDKVLVVAAWQHDKLFAGWRSDDLRLAHGILSHKCCRADRSPRR